MRRLRMWLAEQLDRSPAWCWARLVEWAQDGDLPLRECRTECDAPCWCGKHSAGHEGDEAYHRMMHDAVNRNAERMRELSHERTVLVATPDGTREVTGEVYGQWAVTPRIVDGSVSTEHWTITHRPTGRSYGGLAFPDKAEVRRYVRWLAQNFAGPVWETRDATTIPDDEAERFVRGYQDFLAEVAT